MQKLSTKKPGFTIIEVMCSFSVFTILLLTAMYIKLCTIKMQVYDDKIELYTEYIQDVKTEILSNLSNDQLNTLIGEGKIYIPKNVLDETHLRAKGIADLFTASNEGGKPYLQISAISGDLEEITLVMHTYVVGRQENITVSFYKGNY